GAGPGSLDPPAGCGDPPGPGLAGAGATGGAGVPVWPPGPPGGAVVDVGGAGRVARVGAGAVAATDGGAAVVDVAAGDPAATPASEGRDAGVSAVVVVGAAASTWPRPEFRPSRPAIATRRSSTAATADSPATSVGRRPPANGVAGGTAASASRADSRRARRGSGSGRGASS